jgi:hypothetical protein
MWVLRWCVWRVIGRPWGFWRRLEGVEVCDVEVLWVCSLSSSLSLWSLLVLETCRWRRLREVGDGSMSIIIINYQVLDETCCRDDMLIAYYLHAHDRISGQ